VGAGKGDKSSLETGFRTLLTTPKSWFSGAAKYLMGSEALNKINHRFVRVKLTRTNLFVQSPITLWVHVCGFAHKMKFVADKVKLLEPNFNTSSYLSRIKRNYVADKMKFTTNSA
jgi:hypothetical protein